jgi:hypothetical protein
MIVTLLRKPLNGGILQSLPCACLNIGDSRVGTEMVKTIHTQYVKSEGWAGNRGTGGYPSFVGHYPKNLITAHPLDIPSFKLVQPPAEP